MKEVDSGWRIADSRNPEATGSPVPCRLHYRLARTARCALLLALAVGATACGNIEPWVKPYERQNLADPVMSFDLNPVSTAYMDHVFEAREGARGALGGGGGGCGCN